MPSSDEANIFISYDSEDEKFAQKLRDELKGKLDPSNTQVWMADEMHSGTYWRTGIDKAIDDSSVVVVIVSPASMDSAYVTYEWSYAWFKHHREPYLIYFKECDSTTRGMFGNLRDFHMPLGDCMYGDENSSKLVPKIEKIIALIEALPSLKAARSILIDPDKTRDERQAAAWQLGKADRYLKTTAYNYLLQGLKGQLSGRGRDGVVAQAIADAFSQLDDERAVAPLWRLYRVAGGYSEARASIETALDALCCKI